MNAELSAAGQHRVVVPTGLRGDYLAGLRALSHRNRADPLYSVLQWAQHYASRVDFSDLEVSEKVLRQTNAFLTPEERDDGAPAMTLPPEASYADEPVVTPQG